MCLCLWQGSSGYEDECLGKGEWPRKRFIRRTRINFLGMTVMLCYLIALVFYIWVQSLLQAPASILVLCTCKPAPVHGPCMRFLRICTHET